MFGSRWELVEISDFVRLSKIIFLCRPQSYENCINLDISAVLLLVSNMCEPGGANFEFRAKMINMHVANERNSPAKPGLLRKLEGKKQN